MKNLDHILSKWIYDRAHASFVLTRLVTFGATYVIAITAMVAAWINVNLLIPATYAWGITLLLQLLIGRKRPFECLLYEAKVKIFCRTPSFPSAHATISFAIAFAAWLLFLDVRWFLGFLIAAVWISLSRVAVGVHYVSDIIAGAFIGALVPICVWVFLIPL